MGPPADVGFAEVSRWGRCARITVCLARTKYAKKAALGADTPKADRNHDGSIFFQLVNGFLNGFASVFPFFG
jgi:hypothetical protein